jgi:hypothetical protein
MSLQTASLGIMSADTFKNRTKASNAVGGVASKFKSRGSGMTEIDAALKAWERDCNKPTVETAQKMSRVNSIAYECNKWTSQKGAVGKSTPLSDARAQVVAELQRSALTALAYLKNKNKTQASGHSSRGAVKTLEKGYSHERTNYTAGGKASNPFSGSAVSEAMNHTGFDNVSYDSFVSQASGMAEYNRVEFLNRAQRLEHLVTIENGLLCQNGEPLNHTEDTTLWANTYAIDHYGNIFSKRMKYGELLFNHSSYCAGKEVLCAGTIGVIEGNLVYLSNLSGHYKPHSGYLRQALMVFSGEGVNLDNVMVESMDTKKTFKAKTLLVAGPNAAEDWQHWSTHSKDGKMPKPIYQGLEYELRNPK